MGSKAVFKVHMNRKLFLFSYKILSLKKCSIPKFEMFGVKAADFLSDLARLACFAPKNGLQIARSKYHVILD